MLIGLRLFFIALLLASSGGKLLDMPGFIVIVGDYQLLPAVLQAPAAWALALIELALAGWLISGWRLTLAGPALVALHGFFLFGLTLTLLRGIALDNCGCFGVFWARPLSWWSPLEDLLLVALAVWLWRLAARPAR